MGNMVLGTNRLVDLVASDGGHESYTILSNQRPIESSPSAILAEHEMSGNFLKRLCRRNLTHRLFRRRRLFLRKEDRNLWS